MNAQDRSSTHELRARAAAQGLSRELAQKMTAPLRPSRPNNRYETPAMRRRHEQDEFEARLARARRAAEQLAAEWGDS